MLGSLVVSPNLSFDRIVSDLAILGWQPEPNRSVTAPLIPGEPEMAAFRHGKDRIVYTFNPVVSLRVLAFHGPGARERLAEASNQLPVLDADDMRRLLRSTDVAEILLGILAAGELAAVDLIEEVARLRGHPDGMVARAATRTHEILAHEVVGLGLEQLGREKAHRPERAVLFPRLGDAPQRRQILRWLMHDNERSTHNIDAALRSALVDPDWEVRATAVLAAARLRATNVGLAVRKVELPKTSREGLDASDRRMLVAIRDTAVALLGGRPVPPALAGAPASRDELWVHVTRCVLGLPVSVHDRVFLLSHTLATPFDDDIPGPTHLPAGVRVTDGRYYVGETRIELILVPPVPHWLGDDWDRPEPLGPIRQVSPATGFFMARRPLTHEHLRGIDAGYGAGTADSYATLKIAQAERTCALLGEVTGASVALPTADEWEMAARGPDGRRYPWGNELERDVPTAASPWGCLETVGVLPQWTATRDGSGQQVVCGDRKWLRCAMRRSMAPDTEDVGVRPVVRTRTLSN
jgi:hypothetical protein